MTNKKNLRKQMIILRKMTNKKRLQIQYSVHVDLLGLTRATAKGYGHLADLGKDMFGNHCSTI